MEFGLAIADELKVMAYVEATPAGKPFYEKYGFEEVGHFQMDLSNYQPGNKETYRETLMLRKAIDLRQADYRFYSFQKK